MEQVPVPVYDTVQPEVYQPVQTTEDEASMIPYLPMDELTTNIRTMKRSKLEALAQAQQEKLFARNKPGAPRDSNYFLLVSTQTKPGPVEREILTQEIEQYMGGKFVDELHKAIHFNKRGHVFNSEFINGIQVKYVVETARGKILKSGNLSKDTGRLHIHMTIEVDHNSNITLSHDALKQMFRDFLYPLTGVNPFLGKLTLMHRNMVEQYMLKSVEYDSGAQWITKRVRAPGNQRDTSPPPQPWYSEDNTTPGVTGIARPPVNARSTKVRKPRGTRLPIYARQARHAAKETKYDKMKSKDFMTLLK